MEVKNTSDLRNLLLQTIKELKDGTIGPRQARAIGHLSATIINSAKLDLDYLKFSIRDDAIKAKPLELLTMTSLPSSPQSPEESH